MATVAFTPSLDSYLQSLSPTADNSASVFLRCSNITTNPQRVIICYNLSVIPVGTLLTSASLQFNIITSLPGVPTCRVSPIDISPGLGAGALDNGVCWTNRDAAATAWGTAGGDYASLIYTEFDAPATSPNTTVTVDVKTSVQYSLDNSQYPQQVGLIVYQASGTERTWTMSSAENVAGKIVPTLTITWPTATPSEIRSRPMLDNGHGRSGRSRAMRGDSRTRRAL